MTEIKVVVGNRLFAFSNFAQWCNKAQGWFAAHEANSKNTICVDSIGRVCQKGKEFMRARDENTFPVTVYRALLDE